MYKRKNGFVLYFYFFYDIVFLGYYELMCIYDN